MCTLNVAMNKILMMAECSLHHQTLKYCIHGGVLALHSGTRKRRAAVVFHQLCVTFVTDSRSRTTQGPVHWTL